MTQLRGTGMLAIWCEVPEDLEQEFNRWYNEEHIYERLSVPGILSAARYESVLNGPKHLAIYELESPAVMESEEYIRFKNNPTKWSREMSPEVIGTTFIRNVYHQIFPTEMDADTSIDPPAPVLQIGRMDIPPEIEGDWNNWYNTIYVPNYETVAGVIRGRRYKAVSGKPMYMTFYEMRSPKVSQSAEWITQQNSHESNTGMRKAMQHVPGSPGIWLKTFDPS